MIHFFKPPLAQIDITTECMRSISCSVTHTNDLEVVESKFYDIQSSIGAQQRSSRAPTL